MVFVHNKLLLFAPTEYGTEILASPRLKANVLMAIVSMVAFVSLPQALSVLEGQ